MLWLAALCILLLLAVAVLLGKLRALHKAAKEIRDGVNECLREDTNALLTLSTRDRAMRMLAVQLNEELKFLRNEKRSLQRGNQKLEEAVENVSHDLRTPLTSILGYLELLRDEEKSEKAGQYLAAVEERAEALKELTEELFHYSVEAFEQRTESQWISLSAALEESLAAFYMPFREKGITPLVRLPEGEVKRYLSQKSLSRVLGNILGNAAKYSDGDLAVTLDENGVFTFTNHASGLDLVQTERMFDRFYTVKDGAGSTGLGLSIARTLTEKMGGTLAARYRSGKLSLTLSFPEESKRSVCPPPGSSSF